MNLRPLGYEQYDGRLRRFTSSPVAALTSTNAWHWSTSTVCVSPSRPVPQRLVHKTVHRYRPLTWGPRAVRCTIAQTSPGWSSRHRRPTLRGAGQAPRVKMERPTGRTTLTRGAWSARLALGRWRRDSHAGTSATRQPRRGAHPRARGPDGGIEKTLALTTSLIGS